MKYVNRLEVMPQGVSHHTLYSGIYQHDLGYHVYLPPDYAQGDGRYPVAYHLHGWTGSEASEVAAMLPICEARRAITVFPNSSPVIEDRENLPVEAMLLTELMPHIEAAYRTDETRGGRSVSGFSMGGGFALWLAVRHPALFGAVTAYAGTYHHFYPKTYRGVGEPKDRALGWYRGMLAEIDTYGEDNILHWIGRNAQAIRGQIRLTLRIGTDDPLICDGEIMRLFLTDMKIPHEYVEIDGAGHELEKIL